MTETTDDAGLPTSPLKDRLKDIQVEHIDHMGTDLKTVDAARVSFDKRSDWEYLDEDAAFETRRLSDRDRGLVDFLARSEPHHFAPFTHSVLTLQCKAPIFVVRQLFRHTVGFTISEVSRRYVKTSPEYYVPPKFRAAAANVKQGSSQEEVEGHEAARSRFIEAIRDADSGYHRMLSLGVAPELARALLPQCMMTDWWWTGSLWALARVCLHRFDPHAQREARVFAEGVEAVVKPLFPENWAVFEKHLFKNRERDE